MSMYQHLRSRRGRKSDDFTDMMDEDGEVQLGSQLEEELNRSIEKMREEQGTPTSNTEEAITDTGYYGDEALLSPQATISPSGGSGGCYTPGSPEELLEDIEMPTFFSSSTCDTADLISVSLISSPSPCKSIERKRSPEYLAGRLKKLGACASSPTLASAPGDLELYEKLAFLSKKKEMDIRTLVEIEEAKSRGASEAGQNTSGDGNGKCLTSSPLGLLDIQQLQKTLGTSMDILDLEGLSDSLVTTSFLGRQFNPAHDTNKDQCDSEGTNGLEDSGLYNNDFLLEAGKVASELDAGVVTSAITANSTTTDTTTNTSNNTKFLDLDMEALNDDLVCSFSMLASPTEDKEEVGVPVELQTDETEEQEIESDPADIKIELREESQESDEVFLESCVKLATKNLLPAHLQHHHNTTFEQKVTDANTTFEQKPKNDTTFDPKHQDANTTFEQKPKNPNTTFEQNPKNANTTFEQMTKDVNTTFEQKTQAANTTFDQKDQSLDNLPKHDTFASNNLGANQTFDAKTGTPCKGVKTTFGAIKDSDAANSTFDMPGEDNDLNVTFEKGGEYKIKGRRNSVNLMDAENDILQIILDATPKKLSRRSVNDTSTPKTRIRASHPVLKDTITRDPASSFLRRESLAGRREIFASQDNTAPQPRNPLAAIPGLKLGGVSESALGLRRVVVGGGTGLVRPGPMKALPLSSMMSNAAGNNTEATESGDGACEGSSGERQPSGTEAQRRQQRRSIPSSYDPYISLEYDRPGTPDLCFIAGPGMSTPDICRGEGPDNGPRITSTPSMKGGEFCALIPEGPIPTPIIRRRVVSINSTASSASLQDNKNTYNIGWDGSSHDSGKDAVTVTLPQVLAVSESTSAAVVSNNEKISRTNQEATANEGTTPNQGPSPDEGPMSKEGPTSTEEPTTDEGPTPNEGPTSNKEPIPNEGTVSNDVPSVNKASMVVKAPTSNKKSTPSKSPNLCPPSTRSKTPTISKAPTTGKASGISKTPTSNKARTQGKAAQSKGPMPNKTPKLSKEPTASKATKLNKGPTPNKTSKLSKEPMASKGMKVNKAPNPSKNPTPNKNPKLIKEPTSSKTQPNKELMPNKTPKLNNAPKSSKVPMPHQETSHDGRPAKDEEDNSSISVANTKTIELVNTEQQETLPQLSNDIPAAPSNTEETVHNKKHKIITSTTTDNIEQQETIPQLRNDVPAVPSNTEEIVHKLENDKVIMSTAIDNIGAAELVNTEQQKTIPQVSNDEPVIPTNTMETVHDAAEDIYQVNINPSNTKSETVQQEEKQTSNMKSETVHESTEVNRTINNTSQTEHELVNEEHNIISTPSTAKSEEKPVDECTTQVLVSEEGVGVPKTLLDCPEDNGDVEGEKDEHKIITLEKQPESLCVASGNNHSEGKVESQEEIVPGIETIDMVEKEDQHNSTHMVSKESSEALQPIDEPVSNMAQVHSPSNINKIATVTMKDNAVRKEDEKDSQEISKQQNKEKLPSAPIPTPVNKALNTRRSPTPNVEKATKSASASDSLKKKNMPKNTNENMNTTFRRSNSFSQKTNSENNKENQQKSQVTASSQNVAAKNEAVGLFKKRLPSQRLVLKPANSDNKKLAKPAQTAPKEFIKPVQAAPKVISSGSKVPPKSTVKPQKSQSQKENVPELKSNLVTPKTSNIQVPVAVPSTQAGNTQAASKIPPKFSSKLPGLSRLKPPGVSVTTSGIPSLGAVRGPSSLPVRGTRTGGSHRQSLLRPPKPLV